MAMRFSDFAGQDQLHAGEQRVGDARLAAHAGVFQHQHAALGFLGADHATGFQNEALDVGELPNRRLCICSSVPASPAP